MHVKHFSWKPESEAEINGLSETIMSWLCLAYLLPRLTLGAWDRQGLIDAKQGYIPQAGDSTSPQNGR